MMAGSGSLPQYYRTSGGYYRPTAPGSSSDALSDVMRMARRRVYKRYQMQMRNWGLSGRSVVILAALGCFAIMLIVAGTSSLFSGSATPEATRHTGVPAGTLPPLQADDEPIVQPTAPPSRTVPQSTYRGSKDNAKVPPAAPTWSSKHKQLLDRLKLGDVPAPDMPAKRPTEAPSQRAPLPTLLVETEIDDVTRARRDRVKQAFAHAWHGYETYAFGHDEVRPVSNRTNDSWNGWGVTLVDALDTLYIMGMQEELARAREHVASLSFIENRTISVFETTIRYLGGLLSAHALTGDQVYADKALELGRALLPAFDTETRIPYNSLNLLTGKGTNPRWTGHKSILAEAGSIQLEFKYLSHISGDPAFAEAADAIMTFFIESETPIPGLYPLTVDPMTGKYGNNDLTFGALADSFYEYELKQFLLTGSRETRFRDMYVESMEAMRTHLIQRKGSTVFIGNIEGGSFKPLMDHLVCFVPGMLALGSQALGRPEDLDLAQELAETCASLYMDQPSGIAPEIVQFVESDSNKYRVVSAKYYLRPETIESLFVLYRVTGDEKYREWAWQIFEAIEKHCRTPTAYSGIVDVTKVPVELSDSMQSFFLAETLKYLYLIFSPTDVIPLDRYVFNTEAHPLPIFTAGSTASSSEGDSQEPSP